MTELEQIVNQIKLSTDFQINRIKLREKIQTDLHIAYNQGLFKITTDLLAFLATWPDDEIFLEDIYENPIKINRKELLELARQHYYSIMNEWHIQFNELSKIRKV